MKILTAPACGLEKKRPSSGADLSPAPSLAGKGQVFSKGLTPLRAISSYKPGVPQLATQARRGKVSLKYPACNGDIRDAIFTILKDVARQRHTITYKDLAGTLGLDWRRSYGQCRRLYPILKGICRAETTQDHPMLGAVVVRRDGTPGQGFFRGARDLGRLKGEDEHSFWLNERNAVWQKWSGNIEKE